MFQASAVHKRFSGAGFSAPPAGSPLLTLPRPTAPARAIHGRLFQHLSSHGEESRLRLVRCPVQSGALVMKRQSTHRNESVDTLCVTTTQLRTELFPNHWPNTGGKACPATTWATRPTPLNGTHGAPRSPGPQLLAAEEPADGGTAAACLPSLKPAQHTATRATLAKTKSRCAVGKLALPEQQCDHMQQER